MNSKSWRTTSSSSGSSNPWTRLKLLGIRPTRTSTAASSPSSLKRGRSRRKTSRRQSRKGRGSSSSSVRRNASCTLPCKRTRSRGRRNGGRAKIRWMLRRKRSHEHGRRRRLQKNWFPSNRCECTSSCSLVTHSIHRGGSATQARKSRHTEGAPTSGRTST